MVLGPFGISEIALVCLVVSQNSLKYYLVYVATCRVLFIVNHLLLQPLNRDPPGTSMYKNENTTHRNSRYRWEWK